jgi:hypothetical protein
MSCGKSVKPKRSLKEKSKSATFAQSPQGEAAPNIVLAVYVCSTRHCTLTGPDVR